MFLDDMDQNTGSAMPATDGSGMTDGGEAAAPQEGGNGEETPAA